NIDCPDLERMITEVVDTVTPCDREVRDTQGNWFSLRIRPYKNLENRIDGAVVSIFDINEAKRHEHEIRHAGDFAQAVVQAFAQPLVVLDGDQRVMMTNQAFCAAFAIKVSEVVRRKLYDVGDGQWRIPRLKAAIENALATPGRLERVEVQHDFPDRGSK